MNSEAATAFRTWHERNRNLSRDRGSFDQFLAGWLARCEWQAPDAAPKDGSAFLAYGFHGGDSRHKWMAIVYFDAHRAAENGGQKFMSLQDGNESPAISGWQRLPDFPVMGIG